MSGARLDLRCYVAEAIGTAILVLLGPGAVMVAAKTNAFGHAGVALAFGLAVCLVVSAIGTTSGAHINPAVTIAFWAARRFSGRAVLPYIAAQCSGAVLASLALGWLLGPVGKLGATIPALSLGRAFAVEAGYSAILALVILAVATDERIPRSVPPFAVGATVFAGALVTGPLTGGSFNPARSLGPAVAGGGWTAHWLYWAAPILGMLVAARLYEWLRGASAPGAVSRGEAMGVEGTIN
ncbi:MAG: aquaporin [Gemmatimonadota bacterium]|nr:aquaporin [Gemmatimonadota bacterium]